MSTQIRPVIRTAIADDEDLVRSGMRMVVEDAEDIRVVGEAADGRAALDLAATARPDVFVMDIRMPELDGIEATRLIASRSPNTRVLVVTTFNLDEYVLEALRAGAAGFLLKDSAPETLVEAIRTVAAGDALLSPSVTRQLVEHYVASAAADRTLRERVETLSPRETEILRLVARGMTNAEIAAEVYLGEATVKSHVTAILTKLEIRNRAQIVVAAYESGLVAIGDRPLDGQA